MKYYFEVSQAYSPTWHVKQITKQEYIDADLSYDGTEGIKILTYYYIDTDKNMLHYKIHKEMGKRKITDAQIRFLLCRYDACQGSEHIKFKEGVTEKIDLVSKLFFY